MIELEEMKQRLNQGFMSNQEFINALKADVSRETKQIVKTYRFTGKTPSAAEWYNIPASLDIETTNVEETKTAYMYIAQININGYSTYTRTWDELSRLLYAVGHVFHLNKRRKMVIYVHNLGFEASFLLPRIKRLTGLFAVDEHKPAKIEIEQGFVFRDSMILSGMSLEKTAENMTMFKIEKMVGDLDYSKPRNSKTPMTEKELNYCLHDVTTLTAYIYEQITQYKDITKIPMTNTGRVREYVREHCLYKTSKSGRTYRNKKYCETISKLTIDHDEYRFMKLGFAGGFTHAGHEKSGKVIENVHSYDFTSSYPTVICSNKFPMSKGEEHRYATWKEYYDDLENYDIIAAIEFKGISDDKFPYEHFISESRCSHEGAEIENGRIISADRLVMVCTEYDLDTIKKNYTCKGCRILKAYRYKKDYLPAELINCVLHFYATKTTLKDVEGKEAEYLLYKGMLNSIYGMMVMDIMQSETAYSQDEWLNGGWDSEIGDPVDKLNRYNKSKDRTTFFAWGLYITSIAKHNLWDGILECGADYCYSDTDSVKIINPEKHKDFFDRYNAEILEKIRKVCKARKLDFSQATPKNKFGETFPLGVWDYEGYYDEFKTLGAKRYIVKGFHRSDGSLKKEHATTIAGINKKTGCDYIFSQDDPFGFFADGMTIPAEKSGKKAVAYTNKHTEAVITDEFGNTETMTEEGCAYIYSTPYKLTVKPDYLNYIIGKSMPTKSVGKLMKGMEMLWL